MNSSINVCLWNRIDPPCCIYNHILFKFYFNFTKCKYLNTYLSNMYCSSFINGSFYFFNGSFCIFSPFKFNNARKKQSIVEFGQKRRGEKKEGKKNQNICKNTSKQLSYSMNIISFIINKKSDFWNTFIFFY